MQMQKIKKRIRYSLTVFFIVPVIVVLFSLLGWLWLMRLTMIVGLINVGAYLFHLRLFFIEKGRVDIIQK